MTEQASTSISGVSIARLTRFTDERGFFVEVARANDWPTEFVQMNHSFSARGVLRGLHYHERQADLWYLLKGRAQVALVDLRDGPSSRAVEVLTIADDDPCAIFIPPGVAHGYLALTDVDLLYWVTEYYDNTDEYGVAWNDPGLAIPWALDDPILSDRDRSNQPLEG